MTTPRTLTVPEALARLRWRRRFDPTRPVPNGTLKGILHLATLVPSQDNLQPWRFMVVRDDANRRRLRKCVYDRAEVEDAPVTVIVLGYRSPHRSHLGAILDREQALGTMTVEEAVEVRAKATARMDRCADPAAWSRLTAVRALTALMIAAESLGVSTALVEEVDHDRLIEAFGIPADHSLCGLVALGYPACDEPFPGRLGLADLCYQEHFGRPWTLGEASPDDVCAGP